MKKNAPVKISKEKRYVDKDGEMGERKKVRKKEITEIERGKERQRERQTDRQS